MIVLISLLVLGALIIELPNKLLGDPGPQADHQVNFIRSFILHSKLGDFV
jgi:hypothetical protein